MPIRTSAITYSRGINPATNPNFFLIAQTNNTVAVPTSAFVKYHRQPRPYINNCVGCRWPWSH
jgi:hypothetical protein